MSTTSTTWPTLDREFLEPGVIAARDRPADAADDGAWPAFFDLVENATADVVNPPRPGSASEGIRAAAPGGPARAANDVVEPDRGAWRTLRTLDGDRPPAPLSRLPQVETVAELGVDGWLRFPVPGMYGGFGLRWDGRAVVSKSWCRVADGSGRRHRVHENRVDLVEGGFV
jgi:hypothetical protein